MEFNNKTLFALMQVSGEVGGEFIESEEYAGCYYRLLDETDRVTGSTKEWLNPPMEAKTVYRTIERYEGHAVYVYTSSQKMYDVGHNIPFGTRYYISLPINIRTGNLHEICIERATASYIPNNLTGVITHVHDIADRVYIDANTNNRGLDHVSVRVYSCYEGLWLFEATVKFWAEDSDYVPATITLDKTSLTLSQPKNEYSYYAPIVATIEQNDAYASFASWYSRDDTIATVDEHGYVKAIAPGTTTIVAHTPDFNYAECEVTVTETECFNPANYTPMFKIKDEAAHYVYYGPCTTCGQYKVREDAHTTVNGVCSVCGFAHQDALVKNCLNGHTFFAGHCITCGLHEECAINGHTFVDGVCTTCGLHEGCITNGHDFTSDTCEHCGIHKDCVTNGHTFVNGVCTRCGAREVCATGEHDFSSGAKCRFYCGIHKDCVTNGHTFVDGVCTVCGLHEVCTTGEHSYHSETCRVCGIHKDCATNGHSMVDGVCEVCGFSYTYPKDEESGTEEVATE